MRFKTSRTAIAAVAILASSLLGQLAFSSGAKADVCFANVGPYGTTLGNTECQSSGIGFSPELGDSLDGLPTLTIAQTASGVFLTASVTTTNQNGTVLKTVSVAGVSVTFAADQVVNGKIRVDLGSSTVVSGSGYAAGTYVDVWVFSTGTYLGSFRVNAQGQFLDSVTIPTTLAPGTHSLTLIGKSSTGKKLVLGSKVTVTTKVVSKPKNSASDTVFFDLNSAVVSADSKAKLKALIKQIPAKAKSIKVTINGYVQPTTKGAEWDAPLSLIRAQVTRNYLTALGLKNATYAISGKGKYPVVSIIGRRADILISWK